MLASWFFAFVFHVREFPQMSGDPFLLIQMKEWVTEKCYLKFHQWIDVTWNLLNFIMLWQTHNSAFVLAGPQMSLFSQPWLTISVSEKSAWNISPLSI